MKQRSTFLAALAISVAFGVSARATPINGAVNFDGIATTDTGDLAHAMAFASISEVTVVPEETGTYAFVPAGTPATFTPFNFSASSVMPLWTFSYGGNTYSFNATSVHVERQTMNFLDVDGIGYATLNGADASPGTWSITDTRVGSATTFTFGASSYVMAATPDGGMTAILLGLGLAGVSLGVISFKGGLSGKAGSR